MTLPATMSGVQLVSHGGPEALIWRNDIPVPRKLRALAVSSIKRAQVAPSVPTVAESGFPGYDVSGWYGILAPAKTPADIITRLNTEIVTILRSPAATERLTADGSEAVGNTPEQFGAHIKSEIAKWGKVVKAAGITAD